MHEKLIFHILVGEHIEVANQIADSNSVTSCFAAVSGTNSFKVKGKNRLESDLKFVEFFFSFKKSYSPFLVVPSELPALFFSASCNPSHCWWKSKTKCARSETIRRFCQSDKPFASFFASSSNRPGRWTTTPLPKNNKHYCIHIFFVGLTIKLICSWTTFFLPLCLFAISQRRRNDYDFYITNIQTSNRADKLTKFATERNMIVL